MLKELPEEPRTVVEFQNKSPETDHPGRTHRRRVSRWWLQLRRSPGTGPARTRGTS
ncbi:hypothetical protein LEMLEM_LOCUS1458, partial [Lemmus lemmus]